MKTVGIDVTEGIKTVMTDPIQTDGEKAPGPAGVLLQVKGLTFRTRAGVSLLSEISFHIEPGELVAFTGLRRTGTSTLLRSLDGFLEPANGMTLLVGIRSNAHLK